MPTTDATYGSIQPCEGNADNDQSFDAENAYYLGDSGSNLTFEQKIRKTIKFAFPIIVAIVIMGGFGLYLFRDFNTLYPGRGGGRDGDSQPSGSGSHVISGKAPIQVDASGSSPDSKNGPRDPLDTDVSSSSTISTKSNTGRKDGLGASCSSYSSCSSLGLIGDCCPTAKGDFLDCCQT
jgi:hypothetical protein